MRRSSSPHAPILNMPGLLGAALLGVFLLNAWALCEAAAPTPTTLAKWLEDKEVVELRFAGPRMELQQLRSSIKTKVSDIDEDFRLTPGEGGGTNGSFVGICMKATPENVRRLLAIQEELSPRNYLLDSKATEVWSYKGNAELRAKTRVLAAQCMVAAERSIKASVPKMQFSSQDHELRYEVPGIDVHGLVLVSEITASKSWEGAAQPEQTLHLPHLGMMIELYYRPAEPGAVNDVSAQRAAIRKAFSQSVAPLLKLEPGAVISDAARNN